MSRYLCHDRWDSDWAMSTARAFLGHCSWPSSRTLLDGYGSWEHERIPTPKREDAFKAQCIASSSSHSLTTASKGRPWWPNMMLLRFNL